MNPNDLLNLRRFRRWGIVTTLATIFLIWVGGWVRSTGAGMGCPDWPKCFDMWVPPTNEAQLPTDYLKHYVELRQKKNERVAKVLIRLGMVDVAEKIKNDPSVLVDEPFNAYKTWTEYINRVIGVLVGFFIFLTLVFSIRLRSVDKRIFWLSLAGFIGVGFEGWLGSLVVSTNLMPSFITVHMVLAMLILVVLIAAVVIAYTRESNMSDLLYVKPMAKVWMGIGVSTLILIQIIIGTQVREAVDIVAKSYGEAQRSTWLAHLPFIYDVHRTFYYIVAVATMYWVWVLMKKKPLSMRSPVDNNRLENTGKLFKTSLIRSFSILLLGILILEIALGIGMHSLGIPPIFQPFHLLFATLLFANAFTITTILYFKKGN
jgi:heme a synthase